MERNLGIRLSELPCDMQLEIVERIGPLSMMVARHVLLGTEFEGDGFDRDVDVYRHGLEFYLWCRKQIELKDEFIEIGRSGDALIINWMLYEKPEAAKYIARGAASGGHLGCLQRLVRECRLILEDPEIVGCVAGADKHEILCWLREMQYPFMDRMVIATAKTGALKCLEWLCKNGFAYDTWTYTYAVRSGSLECVRLLHELGCAWDINACGSAAYMGKVNMLPFLHEHGQIFAEIAYHAACVSDNLAVVTWLHEHGYKLNTKTVWNDAAGSPKCLAWLHQNGCTMSDTLCRAAAARANLQCVKYAFSHGCALDAEVFSSAVESGSIDVLEWLKENGCPYDTNVCNIAADNEQYNVFKWLIDNDYPIDPTLYGLCRLLRLERFCNYMKSKGLVLE